MFKVLLTSLVLAGTLGQGRLLAALGDMPVINTVQGTSTINLDFAAAGTHQQIGLFLINSNDSTGFHITFTFTNNGNFKSGTRQFAMTSLVLNKISGTLGGGLAQPVNLPITLSGGSWTWSPGVPTTETDNYLVEIAVSWTDQASGIAGFYQEKITAAIASGP